MRCFRLHPVQKPHQRLLPLRPRDCATSSQPPARGDRAERRKRERKPSRYQIHRASARRIARKSCTCSSRNQYGLQREVFKASRPIGRYHTVVVVVVVAAVAVADAAAAAVVVQLSHQLGAADRGHLIFGPSLLPQHERKELEIKIACPSSETCPTRTWTTRAT